MSDILNKKYFMKFSDGCTWAVPVHVIAMHHAMSHAFEKELMEQLHDVTLPLFEESPDVIETWAKGNMTWDDVKAEAVKVYDPKQPNFANEWLTCETVVK